MIITIHQPEHLPWLGLFNKIAKADKFIILDSVQYEKNYFQNRNRILGTNGVQWLSIPVSNKGHMDGSIANTRIASDPKNAKWKEKYLQTIRMSYGKYPFFDDVFSVLKSAMNIETPFFCEINISIIKAFCEKLDIHPEYIRSTELNVDGLKSDLILDICKETGADVYIAGPSGRDYLDMDSFADAGIEVVFNDFHHPEYPQRKTDQFVSHLSALDLFMNVGFTEAKRIIMSGNESVYDFEKNPRDIFR
nr:WbqC family protein [Clostridia bacterium]